MRYVSVYHTQDNIFVAENWKAISPIAIDVTILWPICTDVTIIEIEIEIVF